MEFLVAMLLGIVMGSSVTYDHLVADTERAQDSANELRIDLNECQANLSQALEKKVCLPYPKP